MDLKKASKQQNCHLMYLGIFLDIYKYLLDFYLSLFKTRSRNCFVSHFYQDETVTRGNKRKVGMEIAQRGQQGLQEIILVSSAFQKFTLYHFAFIKDLPQYHFLPTERNLKIFTLIKKTKSENSIHHLSVSELLKRQCTP